MNRNHLPRRDNQAKAVEKINEKNYLKKKEFTFLYFNKTITKQSITNIDIMYLTFLYNYTHFSQIITNKKTLQNL